MTFEEDFHTTMSQPETEIPKDFMHNGGNPQKVIPNGKEKQDIEATETEGNRCFVNILSFSLTFGLCTLCTQALTLYISSQITTLEKQYNLSSSESGIILSCNDIGFILTVLIFSHFGKRFHIPRILGVSVAIFGISGILSSLAQFISWPDNADDSSILPKNSTTFSNSKNVLCDQHSQAQTNCTSISASGSKEAGFKWVVIYLGLCMALQGVGKSPRSSLGTLYVDRNVDKTKTGLYLGIIQTMGLFGPFFALFLGGMFGKIPVDLQETDMSPSDPRWIGAWWIGFLVFGVLALLLAFPVACFPRHLGNQNAEKPTEIDEDSNETITSQTKDLPKALMRIFTNRVYVLHLIGVMCTMLSIISLTSFGPKYIENQFNLPTWKANIILGLEKLITSSIGTFLGGFLTSRLKLDRVGCFKMVAILHFITSAVGSLQFIFGCNNQVIHDINDSLATNSSISTCYCDTTQYLDYGSLWRLIKKS
ncbi:hypothetical protein KUTeg_000820 [Tegillarca granosa]|uniref:Major facilitator superfamily (MFS) profile domain-containing protein n=1 Tax=Tegillarca granosa TaxID=220873 RepID=A0ABQ9FYR8_TEGGR|nr:hypothetical protein KUTeg_000820 [Tegillarca granosa]